MQAIINVAKMILAFIGLPNMINPRHLKWCYLLVLPRQRQGKNCASQCAIRCHIISEITSADIRNDIINKQRCFEANVITRSPAEACQWESIIMSSNFRTFADFRLQFRAQSRYSIHQPNCSLPHSPFEPFADENIVLCVCEMYMPGRPGNVWYENMELIGLHYPTIRPFLINNLWERITES